MVLDISPVIVGCSGFFYRGWRGKFYPKSSKPSEWFKYYAQHFDTVEINSSFYHFPMEKNVRSWMKGAPNNFIFTVKAPRIITHFKKFRETDELVKRFYNVISTLGERLGCILFQLPPSMKFSEEMLEKILNQLDPRFRNVLEFRHKSWWKTKVKRVLREYNTAFCTVSAPGLPDDIVITADFGYIRFHGKDAWYRYDYSDDELRAWARRVKRRGKIFFIYFNNDFDAYAPFNALKLIKFLRSR